MTKKHNPSGVIEKYKARLVVKGYCQIYGIDYTETLSPVIKFDNLRTILALAAAKGWSTFGFDFTQAYLNTKLSEDIWIVLPNKRIYKLQRALYGLKQAGLEWAKTYSQHIHRRKHWKRSAHEDSIFYAKNPNNQKIAILWIYVDDSGLTGDWKEEIQIMKEYLLCEFRGCDLGEQNIYVGIQLERQERGVPLHQEGYAKKIVETYLGSMTRDGPTPLQKGADLTPRNTNEEDPLDLLKYPY